ncbi:MAG: TetR/AcrR family transcriptional regulator [Solirubrobacterales bacterium]|nr:TetR/AcrR family transcriptional regulator [Solirubrobacterales bacterium]
MSSEPPGSIWSRPEPGSRGAAYSREEIARAAIAIADAEGFEAVSMRRVASELGAGTMTLYHYVRNKDELIQLIDDAIMGELLIPDGELSEDWREATAQLARSTFSIFRNHPWTVDLPPGTEEGPNGIKHFEQSLTAVSGTGLDRDGMLDIIFMVDDYAFGAVLRRNMLNKAFADESGEEWVASQMRRLSELESGEYPLLKSFYEGEDPELLVQQAMEMINDDSRFERGLQILLDGIELRIQTGW